MSHHYDDPGKGIDPAFVRRVPRGDEVERHVCDNCGFIVYENPKIVVGSVVRWEGHDDGEERILMCRREIEPRRGYWTLPAGYLELNESTEAGAKREAWEEARAKIEVDQVLALYDIPRISQIQIMYLARLADPHVEPGPESQEVALFRWAEIPWSELAFPSVKWSLDYYDSVRGQAGFAPFANPQGKAGDRF